jgi:transcriptional regulator with XRE-family HTH domain
MTAKSFLAWRLRLGLTAKGAATALGCSRTTISAYEGGRVRIPRYIALAASAVALNVPPHS